MTGSADPRLAAAERLLRHHGVAVARVDAAGHNGEIAAVVAPTLCVEDLASLAGELRAIGFRYVAWDLTSRGEVG